MKNKKIGILFIELIILILILLLRNNITFLSFSLLLLSLLMIKLFGYYKERNFQKKNVIKIVISNLLGFFIIYFLLGLITGYSKNAYTINLNTIKLLLIGSILIISEEIIRHIIIKNSKNKVQIIVYCSLLVLLSIITSISTFTFYDREQVFIFISIIVIPSITENLICTYLTKNVGPIPSILYRIIIMIYEYLTPIIPSIGTYLSCVFKVIMPYSIYYFSNKILLSKPDKKIYVRHIISRIIVLPVIIILIIMIVLVSGLFKYQTIAIASNSMKPVFSRGDAVLIEKNDIKDVKVGQVIAIKQNGSIVTHRVVKKNIKNNKIILYTKGDANKTTDPFETYKENYIGIIKYSINYIGYPTLWIRDVIK